MRLPVITNKCANLTMCWNTGIVIMTSQFFKHPSVHNSTMKSSNSSFYSYRIFFFVNHSNSWEQADWFGKIISNLEPCKYWLKSKYRLQSKTMPSRIIAYKFKYLKEILNIRANKELNLIISRYKSHRSCFLWAVTKFWNMWSLGLTFKSYSMSSYYAHTVFLERTMSWLAPWYKTALEGGRFGEGNRAATHWFIKGLFLTNYKNKSARVITTQSAKQVCWNRTLGEIHFAVCFIITLKKRVSKISL